MKLHWVVRFLFGPVPVYFSALAILIVLTNAQYFGLAGVGVAPRAAKLASSTPVAVFGFFHGITVACFDR